MPAGGEQPRPNAPGQPVYLDYQATTPTDPRVLEAMWPWFSERFGNPHSTSHSYGREAAEAVERARAGIAALIGAEPREIVFTSGATEANNLAILGAARFHKERRPRVVTCATEHKCVLAAAAALEREGVEVVVLPVDPDGILDLGRLAAAVDERTCLVSVMAANNEIGVLQPIARIGALCRERGAYFHTDAAQAAGKIALDVERDHVDLMSLSAHKMYGPKGIGALYVRRRPRVRIEPLLHGGGQERGLRSGTLPTPLCVGFGEACRIAAEVLVTEAERMRSLRDRLHRLLVAGLPQARLNGHAEERLPGNLNLAFPGVDAERLMSSVPEIAASTGSACSSAAIEPSYVLRALGLSEEMARASLRLSVGRFTREADIDFAAERLIAAVRRLAAAAPPALPAA